MLRVCLKLFRAHSFEKIVHVHLFAAVNPLSRRVDLAVSLDSGHNRTSGHVHFARPFDDSLQGSTDIPLAFGKQA